MIDRQAVVWTYRLLLGREPETEEVVELHATNDSVSAYIEAVLQSPEFRAKYGSVIGLSKAWVWTDIGEGTLLRVNLSDLYVSWQAIENVFERAETRFVRSIVKRGWVTLDIGANLGYFTMLMASLVGETGHVLAFEPLPMLCESLEKSTELNRFTDRVTAYNAAASSTAHAATLIVALNSPNWGGSRIISDKEVIAPGHAVKAIPALTIDSVFSFDHLDFVKIDVEGHELLALTGARDTLKRLKPVIMSEVAPTLLAQAGASSDEYIQFIKDMGYRCYFLAEDGTIGREANPNEFDDIQNVVFIPH